MTVVLQHWSVDPYLALAVVLGAVHGVGVRRRLRALRAAGRPVWRWRARSALFYLALVVFGVAIDSPLDYWSDYYLYAHMIQHILLAFVGPPLVVLAAPWLALQRGLPRWGRQALARTAQAWRRSTVLVRAGRVAAHPVTAVVLFNAWMVFWHLPGPYDLAQGNPAVHIAVEHAGIVALGLVLWLQVLDSPPLHPAPGPLGRAGVAFATNAVMVMIAMTLVLFSHDLYPVYAHVPHGFLTQYSDQQVAGSILWICGEFTLAPAIYWNVQLFLRAQAAGKGSRARTPWGRRAERWRPVGPDALSTGWAPATLPRVGPAGPGR